jgi:hypothetical protein
MPNSIQRETIQPEEMSLTAHRHIKKCMGTKGYLDKDETTAVQRLSQHLRVFGLLSAAGFVKQTDAQKGVDGESKLRKKTGLVWTSLLGQLIDEEKPLTKEELKNSILNMAEKQPREYMAIWRRSLILANHWNFWAKAYSNSEAQTQTSQEITAGGNVKNSL